MNDGGGNEHVFEVWRDRQASFQASVHLVDTEVARCVQAIGRELIGAERYALVKMRLFEALDQAHDSSAFEQPMVPVGEEMEAHLRILGRI